MLALSGKQFQRSMIAILPYWQFAKEMIMINE